METQNNKNSFKELSTINEQQNPHAISEIENSVLGTVRSAKVVGSIFDLYIGKLMSTLSSLFGAKKINSQEMPLFKAGNSDDNNIPTGHSK